MKAQWTASQDYDRASAGNLRLRSYLASSIAALAAVLMLISPSNWPAGVALVVSAAVMTTGHVARWLSVHARAGHSIPTANTGVMPSDEGCLDLAEESPTSRSVIEIVRATTTFAHHNRRRSEQVKGPWSIPLIATFFAAIGWFMAVFRESASWTMTVLMTILAILSFVFALDSGHTHSWRRPVNPEDHEMQRYVHTTTQAKVELHAFDRIRTNGRSE